MFFPGDGFHVMQDNWVSSGLQKQSNYPTAVSGKVEATAYIDREGKHNLDLVFLTDGRIYCRSDCFCPTSPYGWQRFSRKHHPGQIVALA